jgi:hypothetical protein
MARNGSLDTDDKVRLLRALAFQIHRKRSPDEVLQEHIDQESQSGRHRLYRPVGETLAQSGFVAALQVLGLVGDEAASVLAAVVDVNDHRLLAGALGRLADYLERS